MVSNRSSQIYVTKSWSILSLSVRASQFETNFPGYGGPAGDSIVTRYLPQITVNSYKIKLLGPLYLSFSGGYTNWEYGWQSEYDKGTELRMQTASFAPALNLPWSALPWLSVNVNVSGALFGAMLAAGGLPTWHQLAWIVVAMVSARSAAMAFNRLADASIDATNPRTATRALPVGQLTPAFVSTFVVISCGIFVLASSQLNRLTLWLSPVALAVILLYSYTKRFTRWSHLFLGFALGIAPAAAWIAVRGSLDPRILLLTAAVMFWVGGLM